MLWERTKAVPTGQRGLGAKAEREPERTVAGGTLWWPSSSVPILLCSGILASPSLLLPPSHISWCPSSEPCHSQPPPTRADVNRAWSMIPLSTHCCCLPHAAPHHPQGQRGRCHVPSHPQWDRGMLTSSTEQCCHTIPPLSSPLHCLQQLPPSATTQYCPPLPTGPLPCPSEMGLSRAMSPPRTPGPASCVVPGGAVPPTQPCRHPSSSSPASAQPGC